MCEMVDPSRFLDEDGKITKLSRKHSFKIATLQYLADKFEANWYYTEQEVNAICEKWHTFGDFFILRRELIDYGLLQREANGAHYWKQ